MDWNLLVICSKDQRMFLRMLTTSSLSYINSVPFYSGSQGLVHCISEPHNIYLRSQSFLHSLLNSYQVKQVRLFDFNHNIYVAFFPHFTSGIATKKPYPFYTKLFLKSGLVRNDKTYDIFPSHFILHPHILACRLIPSPVKRRVQEGQPLTLDILVYSVYLISMELRA